LTGELSLPAALAGQHFRAMSADTERLRAALADRYRIERELGTGGMATVYLAHDVRHDRSVAVKVLHADLAQELGTERFLSEIKTTARLRHPNILPLFDSGAVEGGGQSMLFYVMPFVEGVSLRTRLNSDRHLSIDESLRIAAEVADALAYAHDHGVIHRDIKPENILLEGGHALVADFGIALAPAASGAERITQTGMSLGTPAYMSPEQSTGDRDIDARSDVYSLACVLYEMLTGEPPFTGPTFESILVQRFTRQPPRVATKRSGVHRQVDAAVFSAMAREPSQRPASMTRFRDALTTPDGARRAADAPKSIAVLPFANMSTDRENEYFSDGIAEEIINALTQLPELRVAARTSAFSFKGKNEDLRAIGEALSVETVLEGSVRKAGNRVRVTAQLINVADGYHLWSERYDRELTDVFAIQDEIATTIAAKLKVTLGATQAGQLIRPPTANVEAYEAFLKARSLARARGRSLFEATAWFERAIGLDPGYAAPHAGLAYALLLQSFWGMARPEAVRERAKASAQRALELDPALFESHQAAAMVAMCFEHDWERAAAEWARVRQIDSVTTEARATWATFWMTYGLRKLDEAVDDALAVAEADPLSAYAHANAAMALGWNEHFDDAVAQARKAVELDPLSTYAHWSLQHSHALNAEVDGTSAAFADACARVGRHPWFLMALAIAFSRAGRRDGASAAYDELSARSKLEYVQPTVLGCVAGLAGRFDDALRWYNEAIDRGDPLVVVVASWPAVDWRGEKGWDEVLRRIGSPAALAGL
jgi:eukaryotic-like serine/threonine-protein kinase